MTRTIPRLLITTALFVPFLFGQDWNNPPSAASMAQRRVGMLTTLLTLTTAQQQQATTIFTNAATADATVFSSMKTARQNLDTAIKNNDSASIDQLATTIGNLTAQLTSTQAKADAAFYQILTADQQTKYAQLEASGALFGPGPGPGPGPGRHP